MKIKSRFKEIKYILLVLFFTMLFLVMSEKKVNAVGYGYLGDVATSVSSSSLQKINIDFRYVTVSPNLSAAYNTQNGYAVGKGNEVNLDKGTYTFEAKNAFRFQNQTFDLKITVTITKINDRVSIILRNGVSSNLDIGLYSYDSAVTVKYDIFYAGTENYANHNFAYGFGDPDGGDYLYSNVSDSDVYYVSAAGTSGSPSFGQAFRIDSQGIKIVRDDIGYDNALILIANNSGQSSFTINWSTICDSARPDLFDYLFVPNIYYKPVKVNLRIHTNGGFLHSEHGTGYSLTENGHFVVYGGTRTIHSIPYGSSIGSTGLSNYNNPSYINLGKMGYTVVDGEEYNTAADGSGTTFDQVTNYAATDFAEYNGFDRTVDLYVKWVKRNYSITYALAGGIRGSNSPDSYQIDSSDINVGTPYRPGYDFVGWRKTVRNLDWERKFINYTSGEILDNTSYPNAYHSGYISLKAGVTYTISGYGSYDANNIYWRVYNTSGVYYGGSTGGSVQGDSYTPIEDCYVKLLLINDTTESLRNSIVVTGSTYKKGEVIPTGSTGNITLSAQWSQATYNIVYVLNGGNYGAYHPTSANYGAVVQISNPSRYGYTFAGWTLQYGDPNTAMYGTSSGEVTTLWSNFSTKVKAQYFKNLLSFSGNVTMVANWNEIQSTLYYYANGHGYNPGSVPMKFSEATYALGPLSEPGYTFLNWNTAPDGSGTSYSSGALVKAANVIPSTMDLYAQWRTNTATIIIRKDNSNWTTDNNIKVALYQGGNSKYEYSVGAKTGATITWTAVTSGTYDIYASKNANSQADLNNLVDTGIDVIVTSTGTAAIDYYTLTLNKGVGISAVSGAGTYLKNQTANIDATVATGYTWQGWSVVSGDSPD